MMEDSDQPAHPHGQVRLLIVHMKKQLVTNLVFNTISVICFGYVLESPQYKNLKHMFYEEIRSNKTLLTYQSAH